MYDRPTLEELIDAARLHIETHLIALTKGDARLYFQTLVAMNTLKVAERELKLGWGHMRAAWARLNRLEKIELALPHDPHAAHIAFKRRNRELCADVRAGVYDYDPRRSALFAHLLASTREQLEVANPRFLEALALEDEQHGGET